MIIDTDKYFTLKEAGEKLKKTSQCVRHYVTKKQLESIDMKGLCLVTKESVYKLKVVKQGQRIKKK